MDLPAAASRLAERSATEAAPWVRRLARAGYAAKGIVYVLVGGLAVAAAVGTQGQVEGTDGALASIVGAPFGKALLWAIAFGLAGLGVEAYGVYQGVKAVRSDVCKRLDLSDLGAAGRDNVARLGRAGLMARGVVFVVVGVFLLVAAWQEQAAEARGLDGALRSLESGPAGPAVLAVVAAGLAAYGAFPLVQARYRTIRVA